MKRPRLKTTRTVYPDGTILTTASYGDGPIVIKAPEWTPGTVVNIPSCWIIEPK